MQELKLQRSPKKKMTPDECKEKCGKIVSQVFQQIYPSLKKQFVADEGTEAAERRMDEIREKILAGNEALFNEYLAAAQKWGLAVMTVCMGDPETKPKLEVVSQPIFDDPIIEPVPKQKEQINLFAELQNCK